MRGHAEATKAFVLGNGLELLKTCLAAEGDHERLAIKVCVRAFVWEFLCLNLV